MIPYSCQSITDDDIRVVERVLRSAFLTQGPEGGLFESALAKYCGADHASIVSSATAALHLACLGLGLGPGDWLWTSPITFVASANCARYCGANVDFVDIDPKTYNMSVEALRNKLKSAAESGRLPKIVVPVHLAGQSCEMREIRELSHEYGFLILEDASHALGATYEGGRVGSCEFSDAAVFSFHAVKMITTGEGGAIVTNNADLAERLTRLRTHGVTRSAVQFKNEMDGAWYYEQSDLGYHYRMTDIQAALGLSQLSRLEDFLAHRRGIAAFYLKELTGVGYTLPWQHPGTNSSWHLFLVLCADAGHRKFCFDAMRAADIGGERPLYSCLPPTLLPGIGIFSGLLPRGGRILFPHSEHPGSRKPKFFPSTADRGKTPLSSGHSGNLKN